jgi:cytochrome c-type biogenesis protein CcmH
MNFWIIAVALLAASAALICWPLFTGTTRDRINAILTLLIIPVLGLVMYQYIGTPEAISVPAAEPRQVAQTQEPHSADQPDMETMVAELQQRMHENPDDPDGWLILGRTLKTMERYDDAEYALEKANRLVPGTPQVMVEYAEAMLFASGSKQVPAEVRQLLESAVEIDPTQQKGLWLLGMASAQDGDEAAAITTWQQLLAQLEPGSGPAQAVMEQIELAQTRMGQDTTGPVASTAAAPAAPAPAAPTTVAEAGIPVTITVADELAGSVPANAALFVFIHPAGGAGMPLAVRRVAARGFPMSMNFTDADLLMPGGSLQNHEQLDVSARISISGIANKAPGDIQADKVSVNTQAVQPVALNLNQLVQ